MFTMDRKRVRRGESFGRMGLDRTISNSLKSPSRQKQKQLSVSFAEETPMIYLCSNFEPDMSLLEKDQRKKELWYSRNDFDEFLHDRISTIRLLKAVQGDAQALRQHCPDLCLRGLEPYQCDSLNQELQCQRQLHQRVVLTEQTLQKTQSKHADPESICQLAQGRSEWARKRAQQLASMDELEVKMASSNARDAVAALRRRSLSTGLQNLVLTQRQNPRRASLTSLGLATPRRVPVDMAILKEWNAKFMQDIAGNNTVSAVQSLSEKTAESRRALQNGFRGSIGGLSATATTNTTTPLGCGELLQSKDTVRAAAPSFRFPVRRDSLVGLRRESFLGNNSKTITDATTPMQATSSNHSAMGTLAAAAAAVSAGGITEACFRFPVRRDSLSNVF